MNQCDQIHLVSPYHDGELTPERTAAFAAHLETCRVCRERLVAMELLGDRLAQAALPVPSALAMERWRRSARRVQETRLRRFAAWMTAAAAAVLVVSFVSSQRPSQRTAVMGGIDPVTFHAEYQEQVPTTVLAAQWMATDLSLEGSVW